LKIRQRANFILISRPHYIFLRRSELPTVDVLRVQYIFNRPWNCRQCYV